MGRLFKGGTLTKKGYLRTKRSQYGKARMVHDLVWEEEYGQIPPGMSVHHKDENKKNNDISNLELLDAVTHKRKHTGAILEKGIWKWKCRKCGVTKLMGEYYTRYDKKTSKRYPQQPCRNCVIKASIKNKQLRKSK